MDNFINHLLYNPWKTVVMDLRKELIEYVKWHEMDNLEFSDKKIEMTVDAYLIFNEKL